MAKCPGCGREFTPCPRALGSALNWRRIACSYECFEAYTTRVEEERRKQRIEKSQAKYLDQRIKEDVGLDAFHN